MKINIDHFDVASFIEEQAGTHPEHIEMKIENTVSVGISKNKKAGRPDIRVVCFREMVTGGEMINFKRSISLEEALSYCNEEELQTKLLIEFA